MTTKYLGVDLDAGNTKITSVATPVAGTDAVNKNYVDSILAGGALYDGGTPSTSMTGIFKIDFGAPS